MLVYNYDDACVSACVHVCTCVTACDLHEYVLLYFNLMQSSAFGKHINLQLLIHLSW